MFLNYYNITLTLNKHKISTRPGSGLGLWLMVLLPCSLILSTVRHPVIATSTYKLSTIFSLGLILSSGVFLYQISWNKRLKLNGWLLGSCLVVAALFRVCLHRGVLFSLWSAIMSTIIYHKLYLQILQKLPNCFTLGEASICCQSYILLLYFTILNIWKVALKPTTNVVQMSTLTIQIGMVGLSAIIILTYLLSIKTPFKFYTLTASIFILVVVVPLQILTKINPLLWIFNLFWEDLQRNRVLLFWVLFSVMAVIAVNRQISKAKKASTTTRKIFHFFSIAVFIPGLLYNCSLLYLASGVVLGIFFMLEVLRVLNLPPLAEGLQNGMVIFGDEKDTGIIAFTPMYLLGGCALPMWIHPAPCDVTNSAIFNLLPLLAGILTTGIGDTAASIVGSKFGRHQWRGSKKTIEGTIACITSQLLTIALFIHLDFVKMFTLLDYSKTVLAVAITSIVEAKTDQVDNLVLPFIMYMILIM